MIPYAKQSISKQDIENVVEVLNSDFLTQGPCVKEFETLVATYSNAKYAIAFNSATSALHAACHSLGVGSGDLVWTTPITFVASANCALYCGAEIDFVDIDPATYNMSVSALKIKLENARKKGKLPKVLIVVHFTGQPCAMAEIAELSKSYNFKIIEDASHAVGAKYRESEVGSCKYSEITIFSFHPVKIITTGEGGMALTNNEEVSSRMRAFSSHGITFDAGNMISMPSEEIWNYQQISLGFNYRMSDISAALGISQMNRLNVFLECRHGIARNYQKMLNHESIQLPWQDPAGISSFHLYVIRIKKDKTNHSQRYIFEEMRKKGVMVNLHYIPVYRQPYYMNLGFKAGYCSEAEKYYSDAITLPMFPDLKMEEQVYVADSLQEILSR